MKLNETMDSSNPATFSINSSYQGFANRQKNLFDQLNIAEHNSRNLLQTSNLDFTEPEDLTDAIDDSDNVASTFERSRCQMKQLQGKESIFKRPLARPRRNITNRKFPDYQMNPHKWTRYSLNDVKSEDMSERGNAAAAMSFLKEMESRKSQDVQESQMNTKIEFKKVSTNEKCNVESVPVARFRNTKVVMPEYVVGQKMPQKRKEKKAKDDCKPIKEVKLDHLLEEDN